MVTTNEPNVYETGVLDSNAEGNFVYTTLDAAINWIRKNSLLAHADGAFLLRHRVHGSGLLPV